MAYLGVPDDQKAEFADFLQVAAATDFWHDFHKAKSAPVLDRLGKSYNIASGLSVVAYQKQVLQLRKSFAGGTLYDMFKGFPTEILLLGGEPEKLRKTEDEIVNMVFPYSDLRESVIKASAVISPEVIGPNQVSVRPTQAPYTITAIPAKVRGVYYDIAPIFEAASGNGCRNFILMIDASFLSIKMLRDFVTDEGVIYNFFIIESVENEGDPATKLSGFNSKSKNIRVYFLRDGNYKTLYTPYKEVGQASNLFSGCTISAYRNAEGLIDADITTEGSGTTTVKNIGTASEPKEAGFLAFQKLIAMGSDNTEEAMKHFLLKRAGDWCQALCLLDRGRPCMVVPTSSDIPMPEWLPPQPISLEELIQLLKANEGGLVEVGVLSHDKILVGYLSALGLNGFLTMKVAAPGAAAVPEDEDESSTSATWLVYIKNTLDSDPDAINTSAELKRISILNQINSIVEKVKTIVGDAVGDSIESDIQGLYDGLPSFSYKLIQEAHDSYDLARFLITLRLISETLSKVREKPTALLTDIINALNPGESFDALSPNEKFSNVSAYERDVHLYLERVESIMGLLNSIRAIESIIDILKVNKFLITSKSKTALDAIKTMPEYINILKTAGFPVAGANDSNVNEALASINLEKDSVVLSGFIAHLLPLYFQDEAFQIQVLVADILRNKPLSQRDGTPFKNLEYFLENTAPSIKRVLPSLRLLNTEEVLLPYLKYDDVSQFGFSRGSGLRFNEWYTAYTLKVLDIQAGGQRGGNTPFDIAVLLPLQRNRINTRSIKNVPYDINLFENSINEWLQSFEDQAKVYILEKAKEIYKYEMSQGFIIEPYLSDYIESVIGDFLYIINEAPQSNPDTIFQEIINENRDMYKDDISLNMIDVGSSVVYANGSSYTALDRNIVDNEQRPLWQDFFDRWKSEDPEAVRSDNSLAYIWLYYRFLLYNLDRFTNIINTLELTLNDEDAELKQEEPYYTEDQERTVKQIMYCLTKMKETMEKPTVIDRLNHIAPFVDEGILVLGYEVDSYVSYTAIVNEIAVMKIDVILQYYEKKAQQIADLERQAAEAAAAEGRPDAEFLAQRAVSKQQNAETLISSLSEFQLVRLFYIVCPSVECLEYLKTLFDESLHESIDIARIFQFINTEGVIPNDLTPEHLKILRAHATAFGDELFARYLELQGIAHGGRHRKTRYPTTRSKRKGKRRLTKRPRQQQKKQQKQKQKHRAITRRR